MEMVALITGGTRVYGVIGNPVAHSLSPLMHNRAFVDCGLDCCYIPFKVAAGDLPTAVAAVRALGMGGINVTIPHKELVIGCLDEVDRTAALIGAVNTVVNRNSRLIGYNTDGAGFLSMLQNDAGFDPGGRRVVLLGAGGAARAVAFVLAQSGIGSLAIFDLDGSRAARLAADLAEVAGCAIEAGEPVGEPGSRSLTGAMAGADLLINATPVGMFPNHEAGPPVDVRRLTVNTLVCDLVYNPPVTRLLREAAARGCRVLPGTGMLAYQGALAFELWTGLRPPTETMRRVLEEALGSGGKDDGGNDARNNGRR